MQFPDRIWIVVEARKLPDGTFVAADRHILTREPLEGIGAWKKGVPCWIAEYSAPNVLHEPPKKGD